MATLKDLAPAEKQKVARLIKQAVEREATIRELEGALAEARAAATAAADGAEPAGRAAALEEQNRALALENTSLRAKLTHAFDLLRTYQHKVRVLDATVAVTGAPSVHSSRPVSPAGYSCSGGGAPAAACQGVDPQLLATQLDALDDGPCSTHHTMLSTPQHGSGGQCHAVGAALCQLSPVAEGGAEGASPAQAPGSAPAAAQHSPVLPTTDSSLQLVPPGSAALPQLETLKMLAQALLEAQAEVAAKQQRREQWGAAAAEPPSGCAAQAAAAQLPAPAAVLQQPQLPAAVPPHAQLVFDASVGPCGGFLIRQQPAASCSSSGLGGGDVHSCSSSPAGGANRPPLAALQQQQQQLPQQQQQQLRSPHGSCTGDSMQCSSMRGGDGGSGEWAGSSGRAGGGTCQGHLSSRSPCLEFGDDLLELVHDVENIARRHAGQDSSSRSSRAAVECATGHWGEHGSGAWYEENDVILLLEQL